MLTLLAYEQSLCDCGIPQAVAQDAANVFTFDTPSCPVCAGLDRFQRIQSANDDESVKSLGEKPAPGASRPSDGRKLYVRQLAPKGSPTRRETEPRSEQP